MDNIILVVAGGVIGILSLTSGGSYDSGFTQLISWVAGVAFVLVFWQILSATPGKLLFSARIVDARTGGKPTFGRFIIRYLGYVVSTLFLGLGFLWVAWDPQKRGWHDMLAGTLVVRPRRGLPPAPAIRGITPA